MHATALATWDRYRAATAVERDRLASRVVASLGAGFGPVPHRYGSSQLFAVKHLATGLVFIAVPGGVFTMGLREAEKERVLAVSASPSLVAPALARLDRVATPVRRVEITAFLCADMPLLHSTATALLGTFEDQAQPLFGAGGPIEDVPVVLTPAEVARASAALGRMRLLSESEYEFVARGPDDRTWINGDARAAESMLATGRPDGPLADGEEDDFLLGLELGEWVADAWHEGYEGAPADGRAWDPVQQLEVARGAARRTFPWQHPAEALRLLCAYRERAGAPAMTDFALRLAMDLPTD